MGFWIRFWCFLPFCIISSSLACKKFGYTLIEDKVLPGTKVFCSPTISNIATYHSLMQLLSQDNVIGIYKTSATAAQVCYWKEVVSGLIPLASLSGGKIHTTGYLTCPPGFKQAEDYCFLTDVTQGNFTTKNTSCIGSGGFLPKIDSATKNSKLISHLTAEALPVSSAPLAIGLKDLVGDNALTSYKWIVDNSAMSFSYWSSGEPSDSGEECVAIHATGASIARWNNVHCSYETGAVCEANMIFKQH